MPSIKSSDIRRKKYRTYTLKMRNFSRMIHRYLRKKRKKKVEKVLISGLVEL